jgi:hypothetical protein
MNLENLNLVELNAQEKREIEGGCFWAIIAIAIIAYNVYQAVRNEIIEQIQ